MQIFSIHVILEWQDIYSSLLAYQCYILYVKNNPAILQNLCKIYGLQNLCHRENIPAD